MGSDPLASRDLKQAASGVREPAEHVGFTGTRERLTSAQDSSLIAWFKTHPRGTFHHGDCVGADAAAHETALYHGWRVEVHPGLGPRHLRYYATGYSVLHPAKAHLTRNADIVSAATVLLACPKGSETLRSGTWSTVRMARRRRIPRVIIWPDGSVTDDEARTPQTASQVPGTTTNPSLQGDPDHA